MDTPFFKLNTYEVCFKTLKNKKWIRGLDMVLIKLAIPEYVLGMVWLLANPLFSVEVRFSPILIFLLTQSDPF